MILIRAPKIGPNNTPEMIENWEQGRKKHANIIWQKIKEDATKIKLLPVDKSSDDKITKISLKNWSILLRVELKSVFFFLRWKINLLHVVTLYQ